MTDLKQLKLACSNCTLSQLCLSVGLSADELIQLDNIVKRRKNVKRNEYLFQDGQPFQSIYVIRSGSFKAIKTQGNGCVRILEFYFPGEIIGFHALNDNHFHMSVKALELSSVCEIPFDELFEFSQQLPSLQRHIMALMGQRINESYMFDPNSHADERIALLLLSISRRLHRRQLSSTQFNLSMSREDIGNYLGLATETVSRALSKLQKQKIIDIDRRLISINNLDALHNLTSHHLLSA